MLERIPAKFASNTGCAFYSYFVFIGIGQILLLQIYHYMVFKAECHCTIGINTTSLAEIHRNGEIGKTSVQVYGSRFRLHVLRH